MMNIADLLESPLRVDLMPTPETDALAEQDALREADLVDVRFAADRQSMVMLFDLRTSLQFRMANAAVLAMMGVNQLQWNTDVLRQPRRSAHYVMSSKPCWAKDHFTLELSCLGGWLVNANALGAQFLVGNMSQLPEAPPDFVEDDEETVANAMPGWDSEFDPQWGSYVGSYDIGRS
jgi:hypothetical protein